MITKKALLALALLSLLLVGTCPKPAKLIRLTVVNKSGLPVEIGLTGKIKINAYQYNTYYLRIPKNSTPVKAIKEFTIIPDKYSMHIYYLELWDPVYGTHCPARTLSVEAYHNTQVVVPVCTRSPRKVSLR